MNLHFNLEDVSQIVVGAFILAVPISFSEEAWLMGTSLQPANLAMLFTLSIVFLAVFTYQSLFQGSVRYGLHVFIFRIAIAYIIAAAVVMLILIAINKFPLLDEPYVALRRLVVITMPASMGAIIVDGFDKE